MTQVGINELRACRITVLPAEFLGINENCSTWIKYC